MEPLVLENSHKIVVPIFGAALRHSNFIWIRSLSTVLSPTKNSRIQGLFETFERFSSTFQTDLIFKEFSRKQSKFKYFPSLCEPCSLFSKHNIYPVLDLGLVFTASLGPRSSTKVETHASFTESHKVSQLTIFFICLVFCNVKH